MKEKINQLIYEYEKRIKEKEQFLKQRHNDVVEGIYIQLQESVKDLKRIQSN
jgi:predicted adenine nucleotide alpha hydrolase (AANH) superfamily ATPase